MFSLSRENHPKRSAMVQLRSSHLRHLKKVELVKNLPYQSPISLRCNGSAAEAELSSSGKGRGNNSLKQPWRELEKMGVEGSQWCSRWEEARGQEGQSPDWERKGGGNSRQLPVTAGTAPPSGMRPERNVTQGQLYQLYRRGRFSVASAIRPRENFSVLKKRKEVVIYYFTWFF